MDSITDTSTDNSNIVFISLTDGAGGAEQILLMLARIANSRMIFLKKASHSSLMLEPADINIKYLSNRSISWGFVLLLKELYKYRQDFVLISSHPYLNAFLGILKRIGYIRSKLATRESTPVFLRFSGLKRWSYKFVYKLGYKSIDLLICQTEEMKVQLINNLPTLNLKKVVVLPNPLDLDLIRRHSSEKIEDPLLKSRNFICSAGRLMPIKGYDILIKAFSMVSKDYKDFKLVILGDGEQREKLQELIAALNLNDRVILRGFVSNPFPYFRTASLCVVSSIREGFPNTLLQMMALNSSVVSTLCADGIDKFTSLSLVPIKDVNAMHIAILNQLRSARYSDTNNNCSFLNDRSPRIFLNSILSHLA